jgi:transketolase
LCINTIRTLSMDAQMQARTGHPRTLVALAPVAYCLWQRFLRFDPNEPNWANRDRFILSNSDASMLLYSMLHLTGVQAVNPRYERVGELAVTLDDIRRFRQPNSKCLGYPEHRWTTGVETSTEPMGQAVATSVGMAIAQKWMAHYFNRPGFELFNYDVYTLCCNSCIMQGVSSEAATLAGHLGLSNLCWIYYHNHTSSSSTLASSENVATRFTAYGWHVTHVENADNLDMLEQAFRSFKNTSDKPTLIILDNSISSGEDTSALDEASVEQIRLINRNYGWSEEAEFLVPSGVREHFQMELGQRGRALQAAWIQQFNQYRRQYPDLADQLYKMQHRQLPEGWDIKLPTYSADTRGITGQEVSQQVLNALAQKIPWLIGSDAALAGSTKTQLTVAGAGDCSATNFGGRNLHFGARKQAMGAILNGLSLCKVRPYGLCALVLCDRSRSALHSAALMEIPSISIFMHDSVELKGDGPSYQSVEHLNILRSIPGLITLQPADANEVVEAWRVTISLRYQPTCLILSRQPLPTLDRTRYALASGLAWGAYILADASDGNPEVLLLASGSAVSLCVQAYEQLTTEGIKARVISMPSWKLFEQQSPVYRNQVFPLTVTARVAVEEGATFGWERYIGLTGESIGIKTFGASLPLREFQKNIDFTPERVVAAAKAQLAQR